jgi:hypothetical protein
VKGRACCRLQWFAEVETVAGPDGAAIFLLLPRAEVPIPASSPSPFLSVFLLSVLPSLSSLYSSVCFFFFLSQFSFFLLSISRPFSFLFCSFLFALFGIQTFSLFFFFIFSFLFFFFPLFFFSFALFPCIYRKNNGERGRGGHCAAAPPPPEGNLSSLFSNTWKALGK